MVFPAEAWRRGRARLRTLGCRASGALLFLVGAVSSLAFAPFHIQPVYLAGLCLLIFMLDDARTKARPVRSGLYRGWMFAVGLFLASVYWVANAFIERGEPYAYFFWVPLILMPTGLALFWALASTAYVRLSRRGPVRVVLFAALLTLAEYLRAHILSGFPWNIPGQVWIAGEPISQTASVIGINGLSALTLLIVSSPAALSGSGRTPVRFLVPAAALIALAGLFAFGAIRLSATDIEETGAELRIVKLGLAQSERDYEARAAILDEYLALSASPGLERMSAVVWPEGAVPGLILREPELVSRIGETLGPVPLILGTARVETGAPPYLYYNSLAVLDWVSGEPRLSAVYDKARLVPFGEGNPIRNLTEILGFTSLSTNSPFYTPGEGASVLEVNGLPPLLPLICYEVIFPGFIRGAQSEAAWLLNISNDSWYGQASGPYQHFNIARYRSIETGLPMVRSASAGVSGLVDPLGRGTQLTGLQSSQALDIRLLAAIAKPFYATHGDSPWVIAFIVMLLLIHAPRIYARLG